MKLFLLFIPLFLVCAHAAAQNIHTAENFPDDQFRKIIGQYMGVGGQGEFTAEEAASATKALDCRRKEIHDLTGIEYFTSLTELHCGENYLAELDVSQNTALKTLKCYQNDLTEIDLSMNPYLEYFDCDNNHLTELNLSNNPALRFIDCTSNQLTVLDNSSNPAMEYIYCFNNLLISLDTSGNTALVYIDCHSNRLTELDFSFNSNLGFINCSSNALTSLNVFSAFSLEHLQCYDNQLTAIDISTNGILELFDCHSNQITALDASQNTYLNWFRCDDNQLTSLRISINPESAMGHLNCSGNHLTDLSNFTANERLGTGFEGKVDVRWNDFDCGDWEDVVILKGRIGEPNEIFGMFLSGFAYSPQNELDPFDCGTAVSDWGLF